MKKFLKFILVIFIWLLVFGVCVAAAILLDYTEVQGFNVFISIFAIWYGIKLCMYLYKRIQAKRRVEKLINVDALASNKTKLSFFEFLFSKDIDKHIKAVIKRLQLNQSTGSDTQDANFVMHLKMQNSHANWLYSSSINRPKIDDPIFGEYKHISWTVFNHLVVLDIDSYLINESNPSANNEWLQLLNGLASSEKAKALDGLLVSIHVADIVDPKNRNLLADILRRKYEEIREYCGVEVPINITLLGLEELKGVDDWLSRLSQEWKTQTLGVINRQNLPVKELVHSCFSQIKGVFKQGSLGYLVNQGFDENVANLPNKINDVHTSVEMFCTRLCSINSFQGGASTSGLFIVMANAGDIAFADELLEHRGLCWSPAKSTNKNTAGDIVHNKRTVTYVSAAAVLVIMLTLLHSADSDNIQDIMQAYQAQDSKSLAQESVISNYQNRYEFIENLDGVSISHWLPMSKGDFNIPLLRAKLATDIQDILILPVDNMFADRIKQINKDNVDVKVDYINILMRRINVLNAASAGASISDLADMPQPYDSSYIDNMSPNIIQGLNDLYLKSLFMKKVNNNTHVWQQQVEAYRRNMSNLILSSNGNMDWLIDWVNSNSGVENISLKDYWQGSLNSDTAVSVDGAYTVAGKDIIDDFIEQIVKALGKEHPFLSKYLPVFQQQYQDNYLANWDAFLKGFSIGQNTLNGRSEWLSVINNLSTGRNIFFKLLNDADYQLSLYASLEDKPEWLTYVFYYQDMLALGDDEAQGNPKKNKVFTKLGLKVVSALGPIGKALAGSGKSALKTKKKIDKASGPGPGPTERELNLQAAAKALDEYKGLLATLVFNVDQQKESHKNIRAFFEFENNPIDEGTSLANAKINITQLQGLIGKASIGNQSFWNVYLGAIIMLEDFMLQESACILDNTWNDDFLYELDGVPDYKLEAFAYGESGVLWSFYDNSLKPFFKNKRGSGFGFKQVADKKMPLSADLLNYLIRAKDLSQRIKFESFNLMVNAKPTSTNPNSLLYVSRTDVNLICAAGDQTLENNNFIVKKMFKWEETCRSVSIKFKVGNKTLEKVYGGEDGVLDFLMDFRNGNQRFNLDEFPEFFYELNNYKIEYFDVNLDIEGASELGRALSVKPPKPPQSIAQCWI
jgi:type VI secretion system protein ImpL